MIQEIFPAIRSTLVLASLTGLAFPLLMTGIAQMTFPKEANGSLISKNSQVIGSGLLGQNFSRPEYFHPRASAASYGGEASSGTNLGPTSQKLILGDENFAGVRQLADKYRKENALPENSLVPVDAVTRSASGLDPHITPKNAALQLDRVAKSRNLERQTVSDIIKRCTTNRDFGILGEPRINVLQLNLALDAISPMNQ